VSATFRPFIRRLLGLSLATDEETALEQLAPERISQLTTLAIREWLLHEAQEGPLMLILDDFHWADDLSRDVLQSVAGLVTEAHILVCVLTRPQPDFELDNPELEEARYQKIEIPPLSDKVSRKLLGTFVDLEGFPATTIDTILTRAEGNPFYIEEFVRMLIEKEVLELRESKWQVTSSPALESLDFPTSLRGLMLARVDRLPENLRYLLQDAAVVGLQFDAALLQEVEHRIRGLENILPAIERLKELDLLELRPQAGHSTYAFRHILTQETVYQSILRNERPELHKVVAESVETLYAYSKTEHAEVLALHYDRARIRDKALKYTLLSGKRAQRRFANREAIEYYSRALQLSQHLGRAQKERWQAAIGLGDVQQHLGEYEDAIAFYEAALEEHQESTPSERAEVQLQLGSVWQKLGDLENAESWLKTAATEIGEAEDVSPALEAEIYSALGWLTLRGGDLPTALALLQRALNLVDGTRHYQALSSILNRVGAVYYSQGEWDKATQTVQRSLEIRERLGDLLGVARSSNNLGILKRDSGDWPGALQTYQRSLEAMETIGDTEGIAIARTNIGNVYIDLGEWEKAERNLKTAYEIAQQIANPYEKAQANLNLGRLYFRKGEWERAGPFLDTAISLYAQAGVTANPNLMDTYWLRSMLYLEQGAIDEATTWGDRNLALLREGTGEEDGESPEWGRYHQLVGRLELAKGRVAPALEHLERAKRIFQENRSYAEVGRTAYWAAQAQLRADRSGQARDELQQARAVFEKLGAKFELSRVQRVLAGLEKATN
jgi:adenylate cyclase